MSSNSRKKTSQKKRKSRTPLSKAVFSLILTLAIGIFLIAGLKLISIFTTYKEAEDAYKTITQEVSVLPAEKDYPDVDMAALLAQNSDTKAYIYIKDLFEYPIVQGTDNEYYLHTLLTGEPNPSGTLFIDSRIPEGIDARNCIIYGHNMQDGSMFSGLNKYFTGDSEFYNSHRDVHIYTPEHHYLYKVVSVYTASVDGFTYTCSFADDNEFAQFLTATKAANWFPNDTELTVNDKLITLSTCLDSGSDEYRNVVVLVRTEEITE